MATLLELRNHHRQIANLSFEGYKPAEIAEKLGMAYSSVVRVLADPMAKAYIGSLQDKADEDIIQQRKRLMGMNTKALDAIETILDSEPGEQVPWTVYSNTAVKTLDYNGFAPVQKVESMHLHLGKDDIEELKNRALEAGFRNGAIVADAEIE